MRRQPAEERRRQLLDREPGGLGVGGRVERPEGHGGGDGRVAQEREREEVRRVIVDEARRLGEDGLRDRAGVEADGVLERPVGGNAKAGERRQAQRDAGQGARR